MKFDIEETEKLAREYFDKACIHTEAVNQLDRLGFFRAPASKGHHLACPGGLMKHSINVVDNLIRITKGYSGIPEAGVYKIGMLHDVVKCFCYRDTGLANNKGLPAYEYVQPPYPGHGVASAMICSDLVIHLHEAERAAIVWHMGAFGLSEKELKEYRASIKRYPEIILLTHAADHIASINEENEEESGNGR